MIQSFKHKGLQRLFEKADRSKITFQDVQKLEHILAILDRAKHPDDISLPGFSLHPLKGSRKGFWAVTVRANWRVIFKFKDGDTWDIELIDYH